MCSQPCAARAGFRNPVAPRGKPVVLLPPAGRGQLWAACCVHDRPVAGALGKGSPGICPSCLCSLGQLLVCGRGHAAGRAPAPSAVLTVPPCTAERLRCPRPWATIPVTALRTHGARSHAHVQVGSLGPVVTVCLVGDRPACPRGGQLHCPRHDPGIRVSASLRTLAVFCLPHGSPCG